MAVCLRVIALQETGELPRVHPAFHHMIAGIGASSLQTQVNKYCLIMREWTSCVSGTLWSFSFLCSLAVKMFLISW